MAKPFSFSLTRWISNSPSPPILLRLRLLHPPSLLRLHLHFSAHTSLTPPTQLIPLPLRPLALDSAFSTQVHPFTPDGHVSFSGLTLAAHSLATKQEMALQLSGRYRPAEHPPKTYWWCDRAIMQGIQRPLASSPLLLFLFINSSSSGCVCVCVCVCVRACVRVRWRLPQMK